MNLTEPQLRHIIREELFVPNILRAQPYPAYIFERLYVTDVLGIKLPLNESYPYSPVLEMRIIEEHLLLESFFSDLLQKGKDKLMDAAEGIKKFGKEAWSILKGFYLAVKEGGAKQLAGSIAKKGINKFLNPIYDALKWMVSKLPDWNMPTFASMAQKGLGLLDKLKGELNSTEGWKSVALFSGVAVGLQWLWNKIGNWVDELKEKVGGDFKAAMGLSEEDEPGDEPSRVEEIKAWLKDTAKEALSGFVGGELMKKISTLATASSVAGWWKAAQKAGEGAQLVVDALGAATDRFVSRWERGKEMTKAISGQNESAGVKPRFPFQQKARDGVLIREFSKHVNSNELVWHRDRLDRHIKVLEGDGWRYQSENNLPIQLTKGDTFFIPKNTYHRVIKGNSNLVVEVREIPMKISISELASLVLEESEKDQNKDGKNDFDDVKIARMKASGMSDEEIKKKHPELFEEDVKHPRQYGAPEGSKRDKQLDATMADLKSGDPERVARAYRRREKMEKKERSKKGFKNKPRKDTKKESVRMTESELRDTIREFLVEEMLSEKLSAKTKATLKKKAEKRGLTPGSVYAEFRKGLAAWASSGSRKGMSQHQWAHARVNSATPSKPWAVVKKSKKKKKKKKK